MDSLNRINTSQPMAPLYSRPAVETPGQAVLDRFQVSGDQGGAAPQLKDMLKLVYNSADSKAGAKPDAVYTALKAKDLGAAEKALAGMKPAERLSALENLRKTHPGQYKAMLEGIHSGAIKDQKVTLGVGVDQLSSTKWGAANKKVVELLKQKYSSEPAQLQFGETRGAEAVTVPGTPDKDGKRGSSITLDPKWASSPEGMAATMAHEGQHAQRFATNTLKKDLEEEVDAHNSEASVWKEFGNSKYDSKAIDKKTNPWDATAAHHDPKQPNKMFNHVAYEYVSGYLKGGKEGRAKEMLEQYFDKNVVGNQLVKSASKDELAGLDAAVLQLATRARKREDEEEFATMNGYHATLSAVLDGPQK